MSKYTTGELAKLCGVTVRTVQYYDTRGILSPSELSEGGRRLYTDDDLRQLRIICFLRDMGLPIDAIGQLLAEEERAGNLPKTILYCLNPKDNYVIGTMLGNFQGDGIPGKIQFGSGWWFCDQKYGMEDQMHALASLGLLGRFVGMLTDSRSFISYPRHEYFRRILCNMIGKWVENGEYPEDYDTLGELVRGICYNNAVEYFGMEV